MPATHIRICLNKGVNCVTSDLRDLKCKNKEEIYHKTIGMFWFL